MRYISTRGGMAPATFSDILLGGLAPDGGLTVPESYPQVSREELESWRDLDYRELALEVIGRFADDLPREDLKALIDRTYTREAFRSDEITPLKPLADDVYILGLSHGPTLAFKDIAMQLLGNLFEYVLEKRGSQLNILGATSGDTGSSAEYAMRGKHNVRVFMLSPLGKMSPFQTAQMFSLQDPNIFNIAVEGVFDDCQDMVKAVSEDPAFKARYQIGTVNSINWARITAQVVYYFRAWLQVSESPDQEVAFSVPSGNFGNILAGHIARQMGLPIAKLILATNENNVLDEFFRTGIYRPRPSAQVLRTSSPSMDISKASNFERFVFDLMGRDPQRVKALWQQARQEGQFSLADSDQWREVTGYRFASGTSNHQDRMRTIREIWEQHHVMVDTHTADGIKVGLEYREPGVPLVCLETALPAKFEESILEALDRHPERPPEYQDIERLPQRFETMAADVEAIKACIARHAGD